MPDTQTKTGRPRKAPGRKARFAILWTNDGQTINTLIYRPEGLVRTYEADKVDPRAGAVLTPEQYEEWVANQRLAGKDPSRLPQGGPIVFDGNGDYHWAIDQLAKRDGRKVLVHVFAAAKLYGCRAEEFAPAGYGVWGG